MQEIVSKAQDYSIKIAELEGDFTDTALLTLLGQIDKFMSEMGEIRSMIEKDDREGLKDKMKLSTQRRSQFNKE